MMVRLNKIAARDTTTWLPQSLHHSLTASTITSKACAGFIITLGTNYNGYVKVEVKVLDINNCIVVVIDVQGNLAKVVADAELINENVRKFVQGSLELN